MSAEADDIPDADPEIEKAFHEILNPEDWKEPTKTLETEDEPFAYAVLRELVDRVGGGEISVLTELDVDGEESSAMSAKRICRVSSRGYYHHLPNG